MQFCVLQNDVILRCSSRGFCSIRSLSEKNGSSCRAVAPDRERGTWMPIAFIPLKNAFGTLPIALLPLNKAFCARSHRLVRAILQDFARPNRLVAAQPSLLRSISSRSQHSRMALGICQRPCCRKFTGFIAQESAGSSVVIGCGSSTSALPPATSTLCPRRRDEGRTLRASSRSPAVCSKVLSKLAVSVKLRSY